MLLTAATLIVGCPETDENFQLSFKVIQAPASGGSQVCGPISGSSITLQENKFTLRLTFLERPRDKSGGASKEKPVTPASLRDFTLVCQRVIPLNKNIELVVPVGDRQPGDPLSVVVEAFKGGKLVYVGRRDDVGLTGGDGTIYLRAAGFSCMQKTRGFRAFHSATLLPNGQVLILGGLVAGSDASVIQIDTSATSAETAYATGDVEVYDPTTLKFLRPTISGTAPRPRGFHVAQLLPSPARGPYRILLVGGVMPQALNQPAFRIKVNTSAYPFLISPHEKALAAPAGVLTYTPSPMKITYTELPSLPRMMFPAATLASPATSLAVAGGAAAASNLHINTDNSRGFTGAKSASWFSLSSGADPAVNATATMNNVRVGHTLARLGAGRYVAVGGNMNGSKDDAVELHTAGGGIFTLASITPKPCTTDSECGIGFTCDPTKKVCPGNVSTVWHTLTPIGSSDQEVLGTTPPVLPTAALWAGGYTLAEEVANLRLAENAPQPAALQLIRDGPFSVALVPPGVSGGFTSVGYHHAIRLHDGSVMLTGGNLATCSPSSRFCGSHQLVIYSLNNGFPTPRQGLPSLRVGRFGHRSTRLLDNTIMITGGITVAVKSGEAQLTEVTERFNPRTGHATEDYPLNRVPVIDKDPAANSDPATTCKLREEVVD